MIRFRTNNKNEITIKHVLTNEEINLKIHEMVLKTLTEKRTYISDIYNDMKTPSGYYDKILTVIKKHIYD